MIFVDTAETCTLLNRRCGHRVAASAAAIRHSKLGRVEHIPAALEEKAWQWRESQRASSSSGQWPYI